MSAPEPPPIGFLLRIDVVQSTTGRSPFYSWCMRAAPVTLNEFLLWLHILDEARRSRGAGSAHRPGGLP